MTTADHSAHFCPGCGTPCEPSPRYPWYFCNRCLAKAQDRDGNRIEFANISMSGGLQWKAGHAADRDYAAAQVVICLIDGRPVYVTEARFGGVVGQPGAKGIAVDPQGDGVTDLT